MGLLDVQVTFWTHRSVPCILHPEEPRSIWKANLLHQFKA